MSLKYLFFCYLSTLVLFTSYGQAEGTAGVGNTTTNRFWYATEFLTLGNTAPVVDWPSVGGNSTSAEQNSSASRPIFNTNQLNGEAVISFDGVNDFLDIPSNSDLDNGGPYSGRSLHMVFRTSADVSSRQMLYQEGGGSRGINIYIFNNNLYFGAWNIPTDGVGSPWLFQSINTGISSNTAYYISFIFDGNNTTTGTISGYLNGNLFDTMSNIGLLYNHNNATIGSKEDGTVYESGISNGSGEYFEGDIAELVIYNYPNNAAERIIIENYLSAKYNITPSASDFYLMDNPANGDFDFGMVGIGRQNVSEQNTSAQGRNLFLIDNPTGMDDGEFLLWGHNGGSDDPNSNTTDLPSVANINSRMNRVYRVSQLGNILTVDIRFELNCVNLNFDEIFLLIDTDDDGVFDDELLNIGVFALNDLGNGIFELNGTPALSNSIRFTFGFEQTPDPPLTGFTGPAGIGDTVQNRFWFDASSLDLEDGTGVSSWGNIGGNADNLFQNVVANRPVFNTNQINGLPSVSFNGSNQFFNWSNSNELNTGGPYTQRSFFIVFNSGSNISDRQLIFEEGGGVRGINFYIFNGFVYAAAWNLNNDGADAPWGFSFMNAAISANTNYLLNFEFDGNDCRTGTIRAFLNGVSMGTVSNIGRLYAHSGAVGIGATQSDTYFETGTSTASAYFQGSLAEFIVYNTTMNNTQRIIIENSLAAKYDVTLGANKIYTMDTPLNGNYDYHVAGIGQINNNIENDARGSGRIRILNPSNLDNDEFLFWGCDSASPNALEIADVPSGVEARFSRVWRVSEVNSSGVAVDVGNIDMQWDLSNFDTITASDLRLIIDANNNGLFNDESPIAGAVDLGNGIYEFQNVPGGVGGIQNGTRFTIATADTLQTPLPVELIYFNSALQTNKLVKHFWATATEINNDFFTIQRSKDGQNWQSIFNIPSKGNSWSQQNYKVYDDAVEKGTWYYRLKQTDLDGAFSYSEITSIYVEEDDSRISIFPNPTKDFLKVRNYKGPSSEVQITNLAGQNVSNEINFIKEADGLLIHLSKLSAGQYILILNQEAYIIQKQ